MRLVKLLPFTILAMILVGISYTYYLEFSAFAFAIAAVILSFNLFIAIDKWIIPEFDTFQEIKNGNIAAAVYVLAFCLLIGLSILAAR